MWLQAVKHSAAKNIQRIGGILVGLASVLAFSSKDMAFETRHIHRAYVCFKSIMHECNKICHYFMWAIVALVCHIHFSDSLVTKSSLVNILMVKSCSPN